MAPAEWGGSAALFTAEIAEYAEMASPWVLPRRLIGGYAALFTAEIAETRR